MHDIEPHYSWEKYYQSYKDPKSPFYNLKPNLSQYSSDIYGYYIHPKWDYIGSETLYIKILFADYTLGFCVLECFGEWNDALNNDVMYLKRNVIDVLTKKGIKYFILIGEQIFNFHGSDDCYYEEWFEDVEDGWIAALNFRYFVIDEWKKFGVATYLVSGEFLDDESWRTKKPVELFAQIKFKIERMIGM
ncbi:MAG: hypothetical protein U0V72_07665 [Cytophagales bacterium]